MKLLRERSAANLQAAFEAEGIGNMKDGLNPHFNAPILDPTAVPPHNTSRTCPLCGHTSKSNRRTQAIFVCVDCGYQNHADVVGAINVLERGHRLLVCGETVQLDRSMKQESTEVTQAAVVA